MLLLASFDFPEWKIRPDMHPVVRHLKSQKRYKRKQVYESLSAVVRTFAPDRQVSTFRWVALNHLHIREIERTLSSRAASHVLGVLAKAHMAGLYEGYTKTKKLANITVEGPPRTKAGAEPKRIFEPDFAWAVIKDVLDGPLEQKHTIRRAAIALYLYYFLDMSLSQILDLRVNDMQKFGGKWVLFSGTKSRRIHLVHPFMRTIFLSLRRTRKEETGEDNPSLLWDIVSNLYLVLGSLRKRYGINYQDIKASRERLRKIKEKYT